MVIILSAFGLFTLLAGCAGAQFFLARHGHDTDSAPTIPVTSVSVSKRQGMPLEAVVVRKRGSGDDGAGGGSLPLTPTGQEKKKPLPMSRKATEATFLRDTVLPSPAAAAAAAAAKKHGVAAAPGTLPRRPPSSHSPSCRASARQATQSLPSLASPGVGYSGLSPSRHPAIHPPTHPPVLQPSHPPTPAATHLPVNQAAP
eukprot:jgi/Mesen1/770/ME000110S_11040